MTTAPVVRAPPAAGTAVAGVPHEADPPAGADAELPVAGDDAPATPLVDPPVHGWVTGGVAGVGGAAVGGGFVVIVVPAGGEAPAVGGLVLVGAGAVVVVGVAADVVVAGGGAGGGGVAVVVVVTGAGAAEVVTEPAVTCPTWVVAAAVPEVAPGAATAVVPVIPPTAAVADATRHRLASSTESALTVTARTCPANPVMIPWVLERVRWSLIRYLSRTVRVTVCRCPAPSSAANRRTSVATPIPDSRRVGRRSLITLCGLVICDSVS